MTAFLLGLLTNLYDFVGALLSPKKIHQHIETALTSWPLAVVIIGLAFRKQLAKTISTMRSLSYKDGSRELIANWGEGVQELKEFERATEAENPLPEATSNSDFDRLMALAKVNRRSAIIEAWLSLEEAARELVEPYYQGTKPLSGGLSLERLLWKQELIGPGERELFYRLRTLRNEASHLKSFDITEDEAAAYIDSALSLTTRFRYMKDHQ
ncbi:hypothetical protein [Agrobacterium sp. CFBP2214]|uniref:hypothetical protein n=1 Tax=Agrobacterium sp. CFBP2214 TaxID=3040274 RepID=UPI00101A0E9B|nr:hypothetical protein [Agrobacterium sp. CFBP2214]